MTTRSDLFIIERSDIGRERADRIIVDHFSSGFGVFLMSAPDPTNADLPDLFGEDDPGQAPTPIRPIPVEIHLGVSPPDVADLVEDLYQTSETLTPVER